MPKSTPGGGSTITILSGTTISDFGCFCMLLTVLSINIKVSSNQILDQSNPPQACLWLFGFSPGADTSLPLVRKPPASGNNATALHSWGDAVAKKGFASTPHWVSLCDLRAFAVNSDLR
jgi:hypothetical protein